MGRHKKPLLGTLDQAIFDATKMMLCGVTREVVRFAFKSNGYSFRATEKILKAADAAREKHLEEACLPTRLDIVEMHRILYADAMSAQKLDTATKVLRSMTDIVLGSPDEMKDFVFDEKDPKKYLLALLAHQSSGGHVPATVMAATARAVNSLTEKDKVADNDESIVADATPPATLAEAATRALKIISGGKK